MKTKETAVTIETGEKFMTWEEYYENYDVWPVEESLEKMKEIDSLENVSTDEISEVIVVLSDENKQNMELFRRANKEKIIFTVEEYIDLEICCNPEMVSIALQNAMPFYTDKDMEELYEGSSLEMDTIIKLCEKYGKKVPEQLLKDQEEELAWERETILESMQYVVQQADYAIEWLVAARKALSRGTSANLWGIFGGGGIYSGVMKHAALEEADIAIQEAQNALYLLNLGLQEIQSASVSSFVGVTDIIDGSDFLDCIVQRNINQTQNRINEIIRKVERVRNEVAASCRRF